MRVAWEYNKDISVRFIVFALDGGEASNAFWMGEAHAVFSGVVQLLLDSLTMLIRASHGDLSTRLSGMAAERGYHEWLGTTDEM